MSEGENSPANAVPFEESSPSKNEDKKEDKKGDKKEDQITINLKDQNGQEIAFKIKMSTKMSKVFNAYAKRRGIQVTSLRFLLDGERVQGDDTPKMRQMEDGDQIDCFLDQVGGGW